ncbi:MAG: 50S ribosomal protein L23 [Anaeromicrobium sp.]|jgi:large subunit ribosomal protein L23|uniref:50S ribosomal protein L23 n=1 Tax=Anaeromicrobium sp. TaxID=1929132 RepID=UPI0025F69157|nr:50S ribosomal protein L23 [Anaeromicrobium sp.]MCT4594493.1 50S ribosomal protein L23 [Anaeromicrobium sp.]
MRTPYDVIKKPVISEKSMDGMADRKYTFEVDMRANKTEVKQAVEAVFGVKVAKVNLIKVVGKVKRMGKHMGKRADRKKAVITLTQDSNGIEFFESMM